MPVGELNDMISLYLAREGIVEISPAEEKIPVHLR